ncbi:MAG: glycoside hydrolase family 28 protein [Bacteroidetes bacterium]|nr:glycoside hydrolase family 28 protein [Bacteroidota bacterium]
MTSYLTYFSWIFLLASTGGTLSAQVLDARVPFAFPLWQAPAFPDRGFDIRDYGAKAQVPITDAVRQAIEACHRAGGGRVLVPQGTWLSGPIHLKSNVNLHLEKGAEVQFSQRFADYLPVVLIQRGGYFCYNYSPMIYAKDCENIAVTGEGTLNGQGQVWWPWKKHQPGMEELFRMGKSGVPIGQRVFGTEAAGVRSPFVQFQECKNILLEGVTLLDGPSWNVHPVFCENLIIRNIKIKAHGPNNDGIDPDGCKNVLIEDCIIDVGDDNICLKSGRDEEAWRLGRPCENVVVRRCRTLAGHGGFVIGSEMSAGVRNVLVEDCHFAGTDRGLRFKSRVGRGGVVENIWLRNISMDTIRNEAIVFDLLYDSEPIERAIQYSEQATDLAHAPVFRNIHMENIRCQSAQTALSLRGLPGGSYLTDLTFKNLDIKAKKGAICSQVSNLSFAQSSIVPQAGPVFRLENCQEVHFKEEILNPENFLSLGGTSTTGIVVQHQGLKPAVVLDQELAKSRVVKFISFE